MLNQSERGSRNAFKLGIYLSDSFLVIISGKEYIRTVLYIFNMRLPKEIQNVNTADSNVTQSVFCCFIPQYGITTATADKLVKLFIGVCSYKSVAFVYARYYAVECFGRLFIVLCSRQTNDFGVVIHCVSVLVHNHIECLCAFAVRYKHLSRPAVIVSFNLRCSRFCIEQIIFFKCLFKPFIIRLFAVLILSESLHSLMYFVKSNRLSAALVLFF